MISAGAEDVGYSLGYTFGRLLCCLLIVGGLVWAIVAIVRSRSGRQARNQYPQACHPPQAYGQAPYGPPQPYGEQPPSYGPPQQDPPGPQNPSGPPRS